MNKPSQFVFIPTEKNSKICLMTDNKMHFLPSRTDINNELYKNHFLYILSDDEIKIGDYFMLSDGSVMTHKTFYPTKGDNKIIATTNPELNSRIDGESFEEFQSKSYMPSISQSDIEYIIGLHNGKGKEVDIGELAFKECGNDHYGKEKYRDGYKRCLQDNADKKFDIDELIKWIKSDKSNTVDASDLLTKIEIIKSTSKEQPKSDTVMVEYEVVKGERIVHEPSGVGYYDDIQKPKLKEGNIVISR